jgi:hypothetical protein
MRAMLPIGVALFVFWVVFLIVGVADGAFDPAWRVLTPVLGVGVSVCLGITGWLSRRDLRRAADRQGR